MKRHHLLGIAFLLAAGTTFNSAADVPTLDAGWTIDQVNTLDTDSLSSPYIFNYPFPVEFRITDQFIPGDTYHVYDFGSNILNTVLDGAQAPLSPVGDPDGEVGWEGASYEHGWITLAPGPHSLTIQMNPGAPPAGFYTRLDTAGGAVPEPGTMAVGALVFGLAGWSIRRRNSAQRSQA